MPTEDTLIHTDHSATSILERAVVLTISTCRWGVKRKASLDNVTVQADKNFLSMQKQLMKCKEYDAVVSHDRETIQWLKQLGLPFMLKNSSYLIPLPLVVPVEEELRRRRDARLDLIAEFLAVYPTQVQDMANRLDVVYRAQDYPAVSKVAESYKVEWQFLDYGVPGRLEQINASLFRDARQKMERDIVDATNSIQQALRASLAGMVTHLRDTLTPNEDGTRKRLHKSAVVKMQEFLATFDVRNITQDAELAAVVRQANNIVGGLDPDALRNDEAMQAAIVTGFDAIAQQLSGLVDTATRRIEFDDDGTADATTDTDSPAE